MTLGSDAPRTLRVAVTDLAGDAEDSLFAVAGPGGRDRLSIGQVLHRRYQQAAVGSDPGYRAEVPVRRALEVDGWSIEIHGRVDGVREHPDGSITVEEIKTHRRDGGPGAAARERGLHQASIYAWMLTTADGPVVRASVVWIEVGAAETPRHEETPTDPTAIEVAVRAALAMRVREAAALDTQRQTRARDAAGVTFPHATRRPGQEAISEAVTRALEQREHLLVSAATGLGKTAAVLTPALRFAMSENRRLVFLTARTTQQIAALETHARLQAGPAAPALRLRSRRGLCANEVLVCHADYCRFARNHHRKLAAADLPERLLGAHITLSPERVREAARAVEACPAALARSLAERAALVVGDYNHALSSAAALPCFGPDAEGDAILILDEVHNVAERARQAAGVSLAASEIANLAAQIGLGGAPIHRDLEIALGELAEWIEEEVRSAADGSEAPDFALEHRAHGEQAEAWAERIEALFARYLDYRFATGSLEADDPVAELWRGVQHFVRALQDDDPGLAGLAERHGGEARLRVVCSDPSRVLARIFARCHSVIGVSATLEPFGLHRDALGLDPDRTGELSVPSPFPPEHRRVVIDATVGTRFAERRRDLPRIAERLGALAAVLPGRCLAVFPSYAYLDAVAEQLPATAPLRLRERPGAGAAERDMLRKELADPSDTPGLVLAVAGGALGEGIDTAGSGLRGVALIGPCLPPPDAERELLRRHYDEHYDAGFELAYVLPGMTRVVQAAGRLIRTEHDRGIIALFGRRFLRAPYRDFLPEAWFDGGSPEDLLGDPALEAQAFFSG